MSNDGSEDNLSARAPDGDAMPWRAEDLLNAVLAGGGSGDGSDATSDNPIAQRVHRYLDRADAGLLTVRLGDADRTYTFPTIGQPTGPAAWPDTTPVEVPNHELLVCIGMGGFGQVWLARHELTEHHRACKLIPGSMSVELDGLRRLKQRVPAHPNLFPIEEVGRAGDWIYCLMPLADSGTDAGTVSGVDPAMNVTLYRPLSLRQHLQDRGRVPGAEAARIAADLLGGLAHLHAHSVTHGDIKPGNILRLGGRWTLADYGLARDAAGPVGPGHTPGYTPAEGPGTVDADRYALGVVMMVMLTGGNASDLRAFRERCVEGSPPAGLDPRWVRLIMGLTSTDPGVRERTAGDLAETLRTLATPPRPVWVRAAQVALSLAVLAAAGVVGLELFSEPPPLDPDRLRTEQLTSLVHTRDLDTRVPPSRSGVNTDATVAMAGAASEPGFLFRPALAATKHMGGMITQDGRVVLWGTNLDIPLFVPEGIVDPVRLTMSDHVVMVLQADGRVVAWSLQDNGGVHAVPDGLPPAVDLACIYQGAGLALLADGRLASWGIDGACSGPGSGVREQLDARGHLGAPTGVERISGINAHVLMLDADGSVSGAGCNRSGQLDVPAVATPVRDLVASESWSCVLDADGRIHAFGFRADAWLTPPAGDGFIQLAAGNYFGLALHESGRIVHWGDNRFGQGNIPQGLEDVVSLVATGFIAAAVHSDGSMTVWGDGRNRVNDWPSHERIRLGDPDLDYNGIADWIDILRGDALDENGNGVPDHAERQGAQT